MDYFEEYIKAKMCLYYMVEKHYEYYLDIEDAKDLNINYSDEKVKEIGGYCE